MLASKIHPYGDLVLGCAQDMGVVVWHFGVHQSASKKCKNTHKNHLFVLTSNLLRILLDLINRKTFYTIGFE
jgi:hypothetical protein